MLHRPLIPEHDTLHAAVVSGCTARTSKIRRQWTGF